MVEKSQMVVSQISLNQRTRAGGQTTTWSPGLKLAMLVNFYGQQASYLLAFRGWFNLQFWKRSTVKREAMQSLGGGGSQIFYWLDKIFIPAT